MFRRRHSPVLLVCLCLTAYLGFHAVKGRHGLEARSRLIASHQRLELELSRREAVRSRLARDVRLLNEVSPDPDLVEELAREILAFARPRDTILLTP